ncbi:MAG: hypothetical protein DRP45_06650 [Candidatus Zixiibacteriota bacterium]|nr:MAG: hypothetical protein DRP45_06650 [candidate division Zixibacteria bacterium]
MILSTKRYKHRIQKSPRIETNEGTQKKKVTIIAEVVERPDSTFPVIIKPYKLDISQFGETIRDEIEFTITNVSEEDLEVQLVDLPQDLFELKLPGEVKAGESAEARLKLNKDMLEESFEKSLTIELNDESETRFTIPVKRTVKKPVTSPELGLTN